MNPNEVLRIVDAIHRDKNIDKEIVFEGIESALVTAARKHYGEADEIEIHINREDGTITGIHEGTPIDPADIAERIGAQTAKQVMIQKIREAERDALYDEYVEMRDQLVAGEVNRADRKAVTVRLTNVEAILPRSEQIPNQMHRSKDRILAVVSSVQKAGSRVKVVLSRTRAALVRRLFEQEIPEISEGVIEIKALAREPGHRTKIAVASEDQRIDCVGACVGVRGSRIRNIGQELGDERIDIVPWSDDLLTLIPNALQPAEVEEVILCQVLGRAICLVRDDQLALAIGRKGQNVRLASKLCGWDIDIMTRDQLEQKLETALTGFIEIEGVSDELADRLVGEGFLTFDDLSVIEPEDLAEMGGGLTPEQVDAIVEEAERRAEEIEAAEEQAKLEEQERRERERATGNTAPPVAEPAAPAPTPPAAEAPAEGDSHPPAESGGEQNEENA